MLAKVWEIFCGPMLLCYNIVMRGRNVHHEMSVLGLYFEVPSFVLYSCVGG